MVEFITSSFWKALGFIFIVNILTGIISFILFKNHKLLRTFITYASGTFAWFYVWQIRSGAGWLVFGIISAIYLLIAFVGLMISKKVFLTDETLPSFIEGMLKNMKLPQVLNEHTRLDSITHLSGKKMLWRFTLLNADVGARLAQDALTQVRYGEIKLLKSNANFTILRQNDITFVYRYMDKEQKGEVASFEIVPSDYK
jgi:hypothetical protein